ncbi:hypothetical protein [Herbidospora sp. RD11066]
MPPEAFYSTAAQVLPTLLIALAIEAGLFLQSLSADLAKYNNAHYQNPALAEKVRRDMTWTFRFGTICAIIFLVGEVAAFLALAFHWQNWWIVGAVGIALLSLCICAVILPLFRLVDYLIQAWN